jgi:hypothetical protein
MPSEFAEYLASYLKKQAQNYRAYLLQALDDKDRSITVLSSGGGVLVDSKEIRDLELLCDAKIFDVTVQFSHSGRNAFKVFHLTELGVKLAQDLKKEQLLVQ